MKVKEIESITDHRPFKIPEESWKYYQEWNQAIFMHWRISLDDLRALVPEVFEIDTFDGSPWISLVAFDMNNIGIKNIPKVPHISDFHELNIRTYIKYQGKPGVYFLSMEGSKRSSCRVLKAFSKLPYRYSNINRNTFSYHSKNPAQQDHCSVTYRVGDSLEHKSKLDCWLTERYALFHPSKKGVFEYNIHHLPWPMKEIQIKDLEVNYQGFPKLSEQPELVHYSPGVKVITWKKKKHSL